KLTDLKEADHPVLVNKGSIVKIYFLRVIDLLQKLFKGIVGYLGHFTPLNGLSSIAIYLQNSLNPRLIAIALSISAIFRSERVPA
ncbi:MAG: hypothetical protein AAB275_09055, partial [Deltaproteobacteria bacterium]